MFYHDSFRRDYLQKRTRIDATVKTSRANAGRHGRRRDGRARRDGDPRAPHRVRLRRREGPGDQGQRAQRPRGQEPGDRLGGHTETTGSRRHGRARAGTRPRQALPAADRGHVLDRRPRDRHHRSTGARQAEEGPGMRDHRLQQTVQDHGHGGRDVSQDPRDGRGRRSVGGSDQGREEGGRQEGHGHVQARQHEGLGPPGGADVHPVAGRGRQEEADSRLRAAPHVQQDVGLPGAGCHSRQEHRHAR